MESAIHPTVVEIKAAVSIGANHFTLSVFAKLNRSISVIAINAVKLHYLHVVNSQNTKKWSGLCNSWHYLFQLALRDNVYPDYLALNSTNL